MMRGSNMGVMPYWLIILLITWGLGRIRTIATPLDRRNATASLGGLVVSEPQSHLLIGSKPNQSGAKESCKTTAQT